MTGLEMAIGVMVAAGMAGAQSAPAEQSTENIVATAKVVSASSMEPVVVLDVGRRTGISIGDLVFVLASGPRVLTGEIIVLADSRAGARVSEIAIAIESASAVVVRSAELASLCRYLPPEVTISGRIARLPPGRTTAWTDLGRSAGLQVGDHVLVRRETTVNGQRAVIPIARGQVLLLDRAASLISLQPLVGNAVTEVADRAELWPAPGQARLGRVNSGVLEVRPDVEGDILTVVGSAADGFTEGRLLDLHRGSRFIGVATVTESGPRPLTRARMITSASLEKAHEADTAILRAPAGPPAAPLVAPVFRIAGDYILVAAGEIDGVQRGEKMLIQRQDPNTGDFSPAYEITIDKVNVDFAGGFVRQLDATTAPLRQWELAEREQPAWPRWRPAGIVSSVDRIAQTVTADVDAKSTAQPGDVIELAPGGEMAPGAAVVLWRWPDRVTAVVPNGWGDLEAMQHAQILVPDSGPPVHPTSLPANPK